MAAPPPISRRSFLQGTGKSFFFFSAAGALMAAPQRAQARLVSANDKVNIALVGCGGMGGRHLIALAENPQCNLVAVCDVAKQRYTAGLDKHQEITGVRPAGYQDFREVLDRADIDGIFVATPDHWHPLLAILGCKAGKDVYVEKPASPTVAEGRAMVEAGRRYGRVVQLGTQQRSMPVFQKAIELVHGGRIGQVTAATAWVGANVWGIGETPEPVPNGLNWDLWLGPAPYAPYSPQRYGGFMGCHDYARGGQLTNWGTHLMDIVHWGIRQDRPMTVQATGGSYRAHAGAENYETVEAILEYPGCTVTWEQRHSDQHGGKDYGIAFYGTEGRLFVDRGSYKVEPAGLGIEEWFGEPERSWANDDHHNNFFHCVRTRQRPAADIEQGVRSTSSVLLAGIALKTGRQLTWDGEAERFVRDEDANRYLARPYRAPWHL